MLIVTRGNSGSGKSTVAEEVQRALGWPTAVIGQDPDEALSDVVQRILEDR